MRRIPYTAFRPRSPGEIRFLPSKKQESKTVQRGCKKIIKLKKWTPNFSYQNVVEKFIYFSNSTQIVKVVY